MSATGHWVNDSINYDPKTRRGKKYDYHTYGVAGSEVEVDLLTGHHEIIETEILMDLGRPINPGVDLGQIEGAFTQGVGLMTIEEELYSPDGKLLTRGPGAYKIPGFSNIPKKFKVSIYEKSKNKTGIYRSKVFNRVQELFYKILRVSVSLRYFWELRYFLQFAMRSRNHLAKKF